VKLFGHPESGHAFKVKFFLDHAGIEHVYEVVDIDRPRGQRQPEFRDNARYGEVPLLRDGDRFVAQSNAILLHLVAASERHGAETPERLDRCREWLFWEANRVGMSLPQIRSFHRYPGHGIEPDTLAWLQARYAQDVAVLELELSDGRPWVVGGDEPTIADFSLCGYLMRAEEAKVQMPAQVRGWLARLQALPAWREPALMLSA